MATAEKFIKGRYRVICDTCGFKFYNTDVRIIPNGRRKGLLVDAKCYEEQHPQDRIPASHRPDMKKLPFYRPGITTGPTQD